MFRSLLTARIRCVTSVALFGITDVGTRSLFIETQYIDHSRNENDRNRRRDHPYFCNQLRAIHARHSIICHHQIVGLFAEFGKSFLRRRDAVT